MISTIRLKRLAMATAAAVVTLSATEPVSAQPKPPASLDDTIRAAELIFEGTVQAVEFRNARASSGQPGIPHTFVTWQIQRIFKGRTLNTAITARFLGGMPNPDELLSVDHSPWPDVGDHDIAFLRSNGRSICPLVGCEDGRLRVVDGAVYSERGQALSVLPGGRIHLGETNDGEGFARWDAVGIERVRGGADADGDAASGASLSETGPSGPAMSVAALRSLLDERVGALYTPAELGRLRPVKSFDPEKPFRFRSPRAVHAPDAPAEDPAEPAPEGKLDPAEVAAYLAAGHSPVIPR